MSLFRSVFGNYRVKLRCRREAFDLARWATQLRKLNISVNSRKGAAFDTSRQSGELKLCYNELRIKPIRLCWSQTDSASSKVYSIELRGPDVTFAAARLICSLGACVDTAAAHKVALSVFETQLTPEIIRITSRVCFRLIPDVFDEHEEGNLELILEISPELLMPKFRVGDYTAHFGRSRTNGDYIAITSTRHSYGDWLSSDVYKQLSMDFQCRGIRESSFVCDDSTTSV